MSRDPVQLTSGPLDFHSPLPSADGKRIYVVGVKSRAELQRYDQRTKQFLPYLGGISASDVSFSPDGMWMAYVSYPEPVIWRSRTDGSQKLQLTSSQSLAACPIWSTDGKKIVFITTVPGEGSSISEISMDGGLPQKIYITKNAVERPSWASQSVIAFGEGAKIDGSDEALKLLDLQSLTVTTIDGSVGHTIPVVSPGGRYMPSVAVGTQKLTLFDLLSKKWLRLPEINVGFINWSKDGKNLYFDTGPNADPAFYRFDVADRKLDRIVSLSTLNRLVTGWISWSGVTPDGSPLLMRDVSTQEVYALDFQAP